MQQPDHQYRADHPIPRSRARRPLDRRALARYLNLWENELDDLVDKHRHRLIVRLQGLLRRERQRGVDGHWSYDIARHRQLKTCLDQLREM